MKRALPLASLCCLIAFAQGAFTLGWRSLWGDEAFTVWASKQPTWALVRSLDTNPPAYYFSVALARVLWGESVFAIRFASVGFGVVFVALAAWVGRLMGGARGAVACAFIIALAPMTSYFEQEARMYSQALMLCAATMGLTLHLCAHGLRAKRQLLLGVLPIFSILALFTHFYTVAILAVNALALLVMAWRAPNRAQALGLWAWAHGLIAVVFGPWFFGWQMALLRAKTGSDARTTLLPPLTDWPSYAARGLTGLLLGARAEAWLAPVALIAFVLSCAGLLFLRRHPLHRWLVVGWVALPIVLALATATLVPEFSPRYFLFALLPLALAGSGWFSMRSGAPPGALSRAAHVARIALAAFVAGASLYGNAALFDARWDKSRYAQALQTVRAQSNPSAAFGLVLVNSDQFALHDYYGPTGIETILISNDPRQAQQNQAQFDAVLHTKQRIWLLNYGAATAWNTPYEQHLKANALRVYAGDFEDASLALFDLTGGEAGEVQPHDVAFGENIRLIGTRIRTPLLAPGGTLALDLVWRASQPVPTDYTVFVHVRRTSDSAPFGAQIAANDSPPANGSAPTSGWAVGQVITDARGVAIPADAPPGSYVVIIGLYQYPSFERLKIAGSDQTEFVVGEVVLAP
jgi:hypothetical protein